MHAVFACGWLDAAAAPYIMQMQGAGSFERAPAVITASSRGSGCNFPCMLVQVYSGSPKLFPIEKLTQLESSSGDGPPTKRRRMRHQHFWRDTDKLAR